MRIDQLDVVLRARSQWEAMELGTALVRRHAAAIWTPWLLLTGPVFVLLNLGGWWLDAFWLPALLMWWLKPVFERIPLYVISRGAFGAVPGTAQTLRAQMHWGVRALPGYLLWRRLSPARALLMPVDLLEGGDAAQRRQRRRVLGGAAYGHATLLTLVCWHFEVMLQVAGIALVFMFVPLDSLPESLRVAVSLIGSDTPAWVWLGFNLLAWAAMTLIGPFYSGAGFGLYLNRRTQLEAWDVEIAFRRLRARLAQAAPLVLVLVMGLAMLPLAAPVHAQDAATAAPAAHDNHKTGGSQATAAATPADVFGAAQVDTAGFRQAAARAYDDPQLGASHTVCRWERRNAEADKPQPREFPGGQLFGAVAKLLALLSEAALWILVGALLLVLVLTARWWLPWLRGSGRRRRREAESEVTAHALQLPDTLPPDILASARRLWHDGKPRHALALLYRASLDELAQRADIVLPPGSTEAQCLRAARRMPQEADRRLFAHMVRTWQYAAYAGRVPSDDAFQALLDALHQQYGWPA
ncbi:MULTISPECIES: DUF4129 domain-containing protein [Stenotrophomonas]|jgi:hypothetical protein|uniref:DUF4129 domain-containing protein n=1 Tax=Stenotrophomonas TaxID=40323 RepID=UPI0007035A7C|nr:MULTISPECIES: DUF4129 domain-containing protein [Stenotrophomonas]KRG83744.1 membrane protein [Stenotrophomonas acidaminiphila]QOF98737.1 DUF4129 domain-containing protein [Stenotrophomonas sp. CW117]